MHRHRHHKPRSIRHLSTHPTLPSCEGHAARRRRNGPAMGTQPPAETPLTGKKLRLGMLKRRTINQCNRFSENRTLNRRKATNNLIKGQPRWAISHTLRYTNATRDCRLNTMSKESLQPTHCSNHQAMHIPPCRNSQQGCTQNGSTVLKC